MDDAQRQWTVKMVLLPCEWLVGASLQCFISTESLRARTADIVRRSLITFRSAQTESGR
jgi:hypothetical protein